MRDHKEAKKDTDKKDNEQLKELIERCRKNDKDAQKEMFEYLRKITAPVAYSLRTVAEKCGLNKEEIDSCISDAMFNVIFKGDLKNIKNFESYFKTSYKFSLIAKIRENLQFYKSFIIGINMDLDDSTKSTAEEIQRKAIEFVPESRKEVILEIMYEARKFFTTVEFSVLILVLEGFTLGEIMVTLNITKYRVYRAYDDAVNRLKNIVKTLFPLFTD